MPSVPGAEGATQPAAPSSGEGSPVYGSVRVREDHGLARAHLPGDAVDEGFPFAAARAGLAHKPSASDAYRLTKGVPVGPGLGCFAAELIEAPEVEMRQEPVPV